MSFYKIAALYLSVSFLSMAAHANSVHGVFKVVKGQVEIISKGVKKPARIGLKVFPQDTIKTGKDSRAKVVMVDNNELNISPESEISLSQYDYKPGEDKKDVMINVIYGKIRAKVSQKYEGNNKFQVKTPTAVAGVRGTDFITSFAAANRETKVITFEGKVEFGLPGANRAIANAVFVTAGQSSSSAGDRPSSPINVPVAELKNLDADSDATKTPGSKDDAARQPAKHNTQNNKDGEKHDSQNNSNGDKHGPDQGSVDGPSGTTGPVAGEAPPPPAEGGMLPPPREPSSISPSFLLPGDTPTGANTIVFVPDPILVPVLPGTMPAPLPFDPNCDFCRSVIESGTRTLIINVINQ